MPKPTYTPGAAYFFIQIEYICQHQGPERNERTHIVALCELPTSCIYMMEAILKREKKTEKLKSDN